MISTVALLLAAPVLAPPQAAPTLAPIRPRSSRQVLQRRGGGSAAASGGGATQAGPASDRPGVLFSPPNSFNVSSFGYTDPNPTEFHPLDDTAFTVLRSDESLLIPGGGSGSYSGVRREDAAEGRTRTSSINHSLGGYHLESAASGDFFGDGRHLTVSVSRRFGNGDDDRVNLRIWDVDAQGGMLPTRNADTIHVSTTGRVEIDCADLDSDGRDEIVVASSVGGTWRVMVFEDAVDGDWTSGSLLAPAVEVDLGTTAATLVSCGEFDGDRGDEIVTLSASSSSHDLRVFDDLGASLAPLASVTVSAITAGSVSGGRYVRTFDHDGDGIDAVAHFSRGSLRVAEVDLVGATLTQLGGSRSIDSDGPIALTPYDYEGTGIESLAHVGHIWISTFGMAQYWVDRLEISGGGSWTDTRLFFSTGSSAANDNHMVALDDDRDGNEELRVALGLRNSGSSGPPSFVRELVLEGDIFRPALVSQTRSLGFQMFPGQRNLALTAGDDDGESVTVNYTGRKELVLSDPMPVVVMEAVPTKQGIAQNYAASGSSFTQGMTSSVSYSTTTAVSMSVSAGVSTSALFGGPLSASAMVTLGAEVARTTGVEQTVRTFTTYGSSHDVHSIVFQGTLHVAYVYDVVSAADPSAIGSTMTINVPVATDEWKWPLEFYNQVFPAAPIRPEDVFAHSAGSTVIGDPGSYIAEAELVGLVQGATPAHDGWVGGGASVGLGGAFNGFGLSLSTVTTTTDSLTLSVEASTEFGVGGVTLGASVGLSTSLVYSIATADDTEYAAQIGDIANNGVDYPNWNYRAGLVVYQERTAFSAPVQVMRYWVDPLGTAYP